MEGADGTMRHVLVIIPTYNEVDNINTIIQAVEQASRQLQSFQTDILVVDDHSPDGTAERVKKLQQRFANITLLSGEKAGLGRAYKRGLHYALRQQLYDAFVLMDADLSHDPADIPRLLEPLTQGADYVIGSRYTSGSSIAKDWPRSRVLASRLANVIAHRLSGVEQDIADMTSGFKAIRREALDEIRLDSITANGYMFQVSLLHACLSKGFRVQEVPVTFANRQHGSSKLRLSDVIEFLYQTYKLNPNAPVQRIVRFGLVGACGTVVNLVILTLLVQSGRADVYLSVAVAIECSILFNFFMNHRYTFKGYGAYAVRKQRDTLPALLKKMGKFNIGALGGAFISFTAFTLFFRLLHIPYILSDVVAILAAMSWNYWMSTRFVWKAIDEAALND